MTTPSSLSNKFTAFLRYTDRFAWLIYLFASPFFLFITPRISWIMLLIPLLWVISIASGEKVLPVTPLNSIFLLLSIQMLVSLYATYDIAISLPKISGLLFSIALFFALIRFSKSKNGLLVSVVIFAFSGIAIGVLGLFGTAWATTKLTILNPLYDLIPKLADFVPALIAGFHPNEVAGALIWVLPFWTILFFWLVLRAKRIIIKIRFIPYLLILLTSLCAVLLMGGVLFLTQSRSAYLGFGIGLILTLILVFKGKWRWIFVALLLVSIFLLLNFSSINQIMSWVSHFLPESNIPVSAFALDTLNGREKIWSRAIIAIQDFSFTGMGMNTFRYLVQRLYPLSPVIANVAPKDLGHAHNEFLQSALDLGIPGLIAFLGFNIFMFWMSISSIIKLRKPSRRKTTSQSIPAREFYWICSLGLLGGFLAHFLFAITDAISLGAKPGVIFWIMLAIITVIFSKNQRHEFS